MKFCIHCGAALAPDAKFCTKCGAAMPMSEQSAPEPASAETSGPQPRLNVAPVTPVPPVPRLREINRKKLVLLVTSAVVILLAGFGWWYTHQPFNLSKTAFRENTMYAVKNIASDKMTSATALTARKKIVYFQLLPTGRFYMYLYRDEGDAAYRGAVAAGSYTMAKGHIHVVLEKHEYDVVTSSEEKLFSTKPDASEIEKDKLSKDIRHFDMTLSGKQMMVVNFGQSATPTPSLLNSPAEPTKGDLAAIDPQAIYERWVRIYRD
ncbi:zinc-ribbon domain-containing protein [Lacticaseibacillus sp. GG6-2]